MKRFTYILLALLSIALVGCTSETPASPEIIVTGVEDSILMNVGDTRKLEVKVLPDKVSQKVEYHITHETLNDVSGYATVDEHGVIRALALPEDPHFTLWIYSPATEVTRKISLVLQLDSNGGISRITPELIDMQTSDELVTEIVVTRNTENTSIYDVTGVPLWIDLDKTSVSALEDRYSLKIYQNQTGSDRTAEIRFGDKTLAIYQPMKASEIGGGKHSLSLPSEIVIYPGNSYQVDAKVLPSGSDQCLRYILRSDTMTSDEIARFIRIDDNGLLTAERMWEGEKSFSLEVVSPIYGVSGIVEVEIKLDPSAVISIDRESLVFSHDYASSQIFNVSISGGAILPYEVKASENWIHVSSDGNDSYAVMVDRNPGLDTRTGNIEVGYRTLTVTQAGKPSVADLPHIELEFPAKAWDNEPLYVGATYALKAYVYPFDAEQSLVFTVSNAGKNSQSMNQEVLDNFLNLSDDGRLLIKSKPDKFWNPNFTLTITAPGLSENNSISMTFHIAEDANAGVESVSHSLIELKDYKATETEITVTKKTKDSTILNVYASDSWIRTERTGVSENGFVEMWKIIVGENRTLSERTGHVFIKDLRGNITTVNVRQSGNPEPTRHTEWVYGVTPPSPDEYVTYPDNPLYFEIYENLDPEVNQGWYLATKSTLSYDPQSHMLPDRNLCWAYTTVNAVHWWYGHNKKYVDAFMQLYPEIANPDNPVGNPNKNARMDFEYNKNAEYVKDKSHLIQIFTQRHHDVGDNPTKAVRDLLFMPRNTGAGSDTDMPNRQYPGWFYPVFGTEYSKVLESTVIHKEHPQSNEYEAIYRHFENVVNEALLGNKAMMLSVHYSGITGDGADHAINLWGVTYDENGRIVELIIGDNNLMGDNERSNIAYLTNYAVSYSNGEVNIHNTVGKEIGAPMGYVGEIYTLGLGTEYWEKWAEDNKLSL